MEVKDMGVCGYCGRVVEGEGVEPLEESPIIIGGRDGDEFEASEGFSISFCCEGCAWAFGIESHRLYGMRGKRLRKHLINEHGLSAGKPAGKMSEECFERLAERAEVFSMFTEGGARCIATTGK